MIRSLRTPLLAVAFSLSAAAPAAANPTWTNVNVEPGQDNVVFALDAVDSQHAWALAVRNNGQNSELVGLRTSDGTSWSGMSLPTATGMVPPMFDDLIFTNATTGYLAGFVLDGFNAVNKIWRSDNGGGSWTEVTTTDQLLARFQALPSGDLYGVGGGAFFHSADGDNWSSVAVSGPANVEPAGLFMLNPTCGWLVGGWGFDAESHPTASDGAVWYTDDGGATFTLRAQGLPYYLADVHFVAFDLGFAVGSQGDRGVIVKTTDGGVTWTELTVPDHPAMPDVCIVGQCLDQPTPVTSVDRVRFFDAQRGLALGLACTADSCDPSDSSTTYLTSFLRTYDGGATWTLDADYEAAMPDISIVIDIPGPLSKLVSMSFADPNSGFLGGQHNVIMRYLAADPEDPSQQGMPGCDEPADTGDGGISGGDDDGSGGCCQVGGGLRVDHGLWLLAIALWLGLTRRPRRR